MDQATDLAAGLVKDLAEDQVEGQVEDLVGDRAVGQAEDLVEDRAVGPVVDQAEDRAEDLARDRRLHKVLPLGQHKPLPTSNWRRLYRGSTHRRTFCSHLCLVHYIRYSMTQTYTFLLKPSLE